MKTMAVATMQRSLSIGSRGGIDTTCCTHSRTVMTVTVTAQLQSYHSHALAFPKAVGRGDTPTINEELWDDSQGWRENNS